MFLSAVTHPRFDDEKVCTFGGKIGIWPFVHQVAAQRSSIYRLAGTMETKSLPVTKQSYADMIVDNFLPMIKAKWPDRNKRIYLQHDNASTHFGSDFAPFVAAATDEEWDIRLTKQPANSPDLNINDLSFFRALQSGQWDSVEEAHNDIDGLIEAVQAAFVFFNQRNKIVLF